MSTSSTMPSPTPMSPSKFRAALATWVWPTWPVVVGKAASRNVRPLMPYSARVVSAPRTRMIAFSVFHLEQKMRRIRDLLQHQEPRHWTSVLNIAQWRSIWNAATTQFVKPRDHSVPVSASWQVNKKQLATNNSRLRQFLSKANQHPPRNMELLYPRDPRFWHHFWGWWPETVLWWAVHYNFKKKLFRLLCF